MQIVLFTTLGLLIALLVVRQVEVVRGARCAPTVRMRLDLYTVRLYGAMSLRVHRVREHVNRDLLVKVLHMITYIALLMVRVMERKLADTARGLRSFRKKKASRPISDGLGHVKRGVDSE